MTLLLCPIFVSTCENKNQQLRKSWRDQMYCPNCHSLHTYSILCTCSSWNAHGTITPASESGCDSVSFCSRCAFTAAVAIFSGFQQTWEEASSRRTHKWCHISWRHGIMTWCCNTWAHCWGQGTMKWKMCSQQLVLCKVQYGDKYSGGSHLPGCPELIKCCGRNNGFLCLSRPVKKRTENECGMWEMLFLGGIKCVR